MSLEQALQDCTVAIKHLTEVLNVLSAKDAPSVEEVEASQEKVNKSKAEPKAAPKAEPKAEPKAAPKAAPAEEINVEDVKKTALKLAKLDRSALVKALSEFQAGKLTDLDSSQFPGFMARVEALIEDLEEISF